MKHKYPLEAQVINDKLQSINPNELRFLNALIEDHEINKEQSIFKIFFRGYDFYCEEHGLNTFQECFIEPILDGIKTVGWDKYDPLIHDENTSAYEIYICLNSIYLFNFAFYQDDYLVLFNNHYYLFDDECGMTDVSDQLFKIPAVMYTYSPKLFSELTTHDWNRYTKFCKNLGFDFKLT